MLNLCIICFPLKTSPVMCVFVIVGLIAPGGTVVEGTAGNTGIGLAHMCLALGYKCVIYMPDNQSKVWTEI